MDPYHLDPASSMYTNAPVSTSSSERDRKNTQEVTPSSTPHSGTPSSSPPRINPQDRRPVATTPSSTAAATAAAKAHQQQHRWAEGTISALGEAAASSPQHKNLTTLFEREKAKNKDLQNKKSSSGSGGSGSSNWIERLSGGGKGIGKGTEKNDESKGKGGKKEGERKGFFQKGREGLLAREMERANPSFWRPSG
ncbi:hypothetical protein GJ744_000403 [Endocarpon pusillum]|uniref:Uncharacterized protein n=1 Tax=Endocarpon pusillum TaxID=364733 RepID=A0A8H7E2L5_9EURO|nr:hypothetical protein GJ744_000403 [Endocarpon pusillum]